MNLSRMAKFSFKTTTAIVLSIVGLVSAGALPASANNAGSLKLTGITAPSGYSFRDAGVLYEPVTDQGTICFIVHGLTDGQSATLDQVVVTVVSDTVNGRYTDDQSYSTNGYDDGSGTIIGDLCVAVPADATGLLDPIAFDSISVSGTFTPDTGDGGDGGDGGGDTGIGSVGVVDGKFDLTGVNGPTGTSVTNPYASTDPDTGDTSLCMTVGGVDQDQYGYLRNVHISVATDDLTTNDVLTDGYMLQGADNGDGTTGGDICLPLNPNVAQAVVDDTFNSVIVSADLFVPSVDVTVDDSQDTGVSIDSSFASTFDSSTGLTSGCFVLDGLTSDDSISVTDIVVTTSQNGVPADATLDDQVFALGEDDGTTACLSVDPSIDPQVADLGDLQTAESISLTANLHFTSTVSDSFATFMGTKGVSVSDVKIIRRGSGAQIVATMRPKAKKAVYVAPSKMKFDGIALTPLAKVWVLPPGKDTTLGVAYSTKNFSVDHLDAPLNVKVAPLAPSLVKTKSLDLPAGITLGAVDPATWDYSDLDPDQYYPAIDNKTTLCALLKNSTKKAIDLDLNFTWSIGKVSKAGKGTQYVEIPAKGSACISGVGDPSALLWSGDVRFGSTITVKGSADVVPATKVSLSGVRKPTGYTVKSVPAAYDYNPATKLTTVSLLVEDKADNNISGLTMSKIQINGVAVKVPAVAVNAPDPTSGDGNWYLKIGTVRGDVRAKSNIVISGTIDEVVVTTVDDNGVKSTDADSRTQCTLQSPSEWTYDPATRTTLVGYVCTNYQAVGKTVDFSKLTLTYSIDGTPSGSITAKSGLTAVKLPKGTGDVNPVSVGVFKVPSDIRSGGMKVKVTGTLDYN